MMRVCHVCNVHPVDDGRVFARSCVSLAEAGYEVHLIAVGKRTESYCHQGVTIHPLPESYSRRKRFMRRTAVAQMAADLNPDLLHVHEPELLGAVLATAGSRPVIYDVHESYLDVLTERDWLPRWTKPLMRLAWDKWERQLVRRCAGIVVVTDPIAQRYHQLHSQVEVVANYPDLVGIEDLPPVTRDGKTCVFTGAMSPTRGLMQVFAALALLKERGLMVTLQLAGPAVSDEFLQSLWAEVARLDIKELVVYHGVVSKHEAMRMQHSASIGLVPYLPVANNVAGMPNKLVECMALGLPVVFSDFPIYRQIAGSSGAGIAVDPTQPKQIADAIERLICHPDLAQQMGEAGKRAVATQFNWGVERAKLLALYRKILAVSDLNTGRHFPANSV